MRIKVINDKKFKSIYISYNFTFKIIKEEVPGSVITSLVLSKACNKYTSQKEIEKYLYSLYGANFDVNFEKVGDLYNIEFAVECVNDKFLPNNEQVVNSAIEFLYNIIYKPKLIDGKFDASIFEREKQFVMDKINSRKDEKLKYAVTHTEELLCKDEPFGTYIYGDINDAEKVSLDDITAGYNKLINKSCITVIVSGNLEGYDDITSNIENVFENKLNSNNNLSVDKVNSTDFNEIREKMQTNQSVITVGMRVKDLKEDDFYALNIYNAILGETPSSKLFQNVREKESLSYTARSRYYRFKGIFVIYAGIEEKNYDKAKTVILKQIEDMKNGNISNDELNSAKQSLVGDLREWKDSKKALAKLEYSNLITNTSLTVDSIIEKLSNITIEDVVNIAERVNLELIYFLGGDNNE